jgi:hypothetical protein
MNRTTKGKKFLSMNRENRKDRAVMEIQKKTKGGTNGENDDPAFKRCPSPRFTR